MVETQELPSAIKSQPIVEFLAAPHRPIGKKWPIIWDGGGVHTSHRVCNCLEAQNGRIAIALLPPYAPELNPVEAIWAYLKKNGIASLCPTTVAQGGNFAHRRLKSLPPRPNLILAFWRQAEPAL